MWKKLVKNKAVENSMLNSICLEVTDVVVVTRVIIGTRSMYCAVMK